MPFWPSSRSRTGTAEGDSSGSRAHSSRTLASAYRFTGDSVDGLNRVFLVGTLGSDAEVRMTSNGKPVMSFRIATTESWLDNNRQRQEATEWHSCVKFGGEKLAPYLTKGKKVHIEGSLATRSWDKDGQKHTRTEIKVRSIILCDGPRGGGDRRQERLPGADDDDFPL